MNFLAGVQKFARKAGATSQPSAVTSQTGEAQRLVDDYIDAYTEIQNKHPWRWLRRGFTFNTTSGDDSYAYGDVTDVDAGTAIARFSEWRLSDPRDPPKIYLTSTGVSGERWLVYIPWEDFKRIYKIGSQSSNTSAPAHISVDPLDNIVLGPSPNGIYTVTGDFIRSAQILAADADIPEMPTQFHNLIVYKAIEKYAIYEEVAPQILAYAQSESKRMMRQLENNQCPKFRMARSLA